MALEDSKAITLNKVLDTIFNGMGMKDTKYVTNSQELLATIPKEDRNPTKCIEIQHNESSEQLGTISDTTKVVGFSLPLGRCEHVLNEYR